MIKLFNSTDTSFSSNGDIFTIVTPDENEPRANFKLLKEVNED